MKYLHTVMFVSRNKDNKNVAEFKQRSENFLTEKTPQELMQKFHEFGERGVQGEVSRFYMSVNPRCPRKLQLALQHHLLDNEVSFHRIEKILCSLASKKEQSAGRDFLFDLDVSDAEKDSFIAELENHPQITKVEVFKTYNNWGCVTNPFHAEPLLEKFPEVELKRDEDRYIAHYKKNP